LAPTPKSLNGLESALPICYSCCRNWRDNWHAAGGTFSIGAPRRDHWFCPECCKCVICGRKDGLRIDTLDYDSPIATAVFYCEEHKQVATESDGLTYSQMPRDHLQHYLEYLTYQRETLMNVNTPLSERRLPLVNGLWHEISKILRRTAGDEAQGAHAREQGGVVVRETVREIVNIPCRYCGTFSPITEQKCSNCGAPLMKR